MDAIKRMESSYNTFKEWFDDDGTFEDLKSLPNIEILGGAKSMSTIKSSLIQSQKYELAARVRDIEKHLLTLIRDFYTEYGHLDDSKLLEVIIEKEIRRENRNNNLTKLDED